MISSQFTEEVEIERTVDPATLESGRFVYPSPTFLTIRASVQPVTSAEELIKQPEGSREREQIKLYTSTALRTGNEKEMLKADIVRYNDKRYEIVSVARYTRVLPHFKCMALAVFEEGS